MKTKAVFRLAILSVIVMGSQFLLAPNASAAVADWQRGATIVPRWNTDFSSQSFQQSVRNLQSTGANWVTLNIPIHQSNIGSTDLQTGGDTPTDQSIIDGVNFIHSLGMHVMLRVQNMPYDGQWSANINPGDRGTWFANYGNFLNRYAGIAQQTGTEELCIGVELYRMAAQTQDFSNTANWNNLIGNVRKIYSGKLTYSSNWGGPNEAAEIQFWNNLDYVGVSAYFDLFGDGSVGSLVSDWGGVNSSDLASLQQKWGKPILFTELGYRSYSGAHNQPWNWWTGGDINQQEQANDYTALFQYWGGQSNFAGVQLWNWSSDPNVGGNNNDYTPQNKLAQGVMSQFWSNVGPGTGGTGGTGTGGSTSTTGGVIGDSAFTLGATTSPAAPAPGDSMSFTATANDTSGASSNDIVDFEIYSGGNKTYQQLFAGQNFNAGQSQTYAAQWTAGAAGTYVAKVGVFSGDWSHLYSWNDSALTFTIGASSGGTGGTGSGGTSGSTGGSTSTTSGGGTTGGSTSTTTSGGTTGTFTSSASVNPASPSVGSATSFPLSVTASSGALANGIVDFEVYNGSTKAFQQLFTGQNFAAGQTQNYTASWTPGSTGSYVAKIGVFSGDWSALYSWNDSTLTFTIGGGSGGTSGSTGGSTSTTAGGGTTGPTIVLINGYPTINGNYIDCNGNIDNDPAHHTLITSDPDPAHHSGQNCPAGTLVANYGSH